MQSKTTEARNLVPGQRLISDDGQQLTVSQVTRGMIHLNNRPTVLVTFSNGEFAHLIATTAVVTI